VTKPDASDVEVDGGVAGMLDSAVADGASGEAEMVPIATVSERVGELSVTGVGEHAPSTTANRKTALATRLVTPAPFLAAASARGSLRRCGAILSWSRPI
jgi:hypothetical protein